MKRKNQFLWLIAPLAMGMLILDTKTAIVAANDGMDMCIRSVIPSLFPFIIISTCTTQALLGRFKRLLRPVGRLCKIPEGCESLLLTGLLGGYPVGAQCIYQAYRARVLSAKDAERMICFCNNAGPAFILGIVGSLFSDSWTVWLIWGIHISSALIVGMLIPGTTQSTHKAIEGKNISFVSAIQGSVKTMANICGFVLLFRVIIAYADKYLLHYLPQPLSIAITGFLELTNGCLLLQNITDESVRFLICSTLLSFGGVCISLQTVSVVGDIDSSVYFPGKVIQCCISMTLSMLLLPVMFDNTRFYMPVIIFSVCALSMVVCCITRLVHKKTIAISQNMIYNGKKSYIRGSHYAL